MTIDDLSAHPFSLAGVTRWNRGARFVAPVMMLALFLRGTASAVDGSCGGDPVANTANVLCAPPSGPCDANSVNVTAPISVSSGGCTFDLGGRALAVNKRFDVVGTGYIAVKNAGDVTIDPSGGLRARGDFAAPTGTIFPGGTISVESSGRITHGGVIDVYGDPAGSVRLAGTGDVVLSLGSIIAANGDTVETDGSERLADGGTLDIVSSAGSVRIFGDVVMTGQVQAEGGDIVLEAARDVQVSQAIDVSGGGGGGGSITIVAGDNVTIAKRLDAQSAGGGGPGGDVSVQAGADDLSSAVLGGTVSVSGGNVSLNGSGLGGNDDDGGSLQIDAQGDIAIASTTAIMANAASGTTGDGGSIDLDAGATGNVQLDGPIYATSGSQGGAGGNLAAAAGGNVTLSSAADVTLDGNDQGGALSVTAEGAYTQYSTVQANGTTVGAPGGTIGVDACTVSLPSGSRIEATGTNGGRIALTGRDHVTVGATSVETASGTGGSIELITRSFGTCSNNPAQHCLSNAGCTSGCNTGTCQNVNPDTAGTTAQFTPAPVFTEDPSLPTCQ